MTTKISKVFSVLYSSTDEDASTWRKEVFDDVCHDVGIANEVAIHVVYWKDIAGGVAKRTGQDRIDASILGNYDIYFGCLGLRYGNGTVSEFSDALKGHVENDVPSEVLFAFDATPVDPFSVPDTFNKVKKLRSDIQNSKKYGRAILYFMFKNRDEYRKYLFRDLNEAIKARLSLIKGGPIPFR